MTRQRRGKGRGGVETVYLFRCRVVRSNVTSIRYFCLFYYTYVIIFLNILLVSLLSLHLLRVNSLSREPTTRSKKRFPSLNGQKIYPFRSSLILLRPFPRQYCHPSFKTPPTELDKSVTICLYGF